MKHQEEFKAKMKLIKKSEVELLKQKRISVMMKQVKAVASIHLLIKTEDGILAHIDKKQAFNEIIKKINDTEKSKNITYLYITKQEFKKEHKKS